MAQQKEQVLTDQQLIECLTTDSLSDAQIIRRGHLISMQAQEVSRDKVRAENEKWKAAAEHQQIMWRARCEDIKAMQAKEEAERKKCLHASGGQDYRGFFAGENEAGYGACISTQQLPTGEIRALCFRCQKGWVHPAWHMAYYPGFGNDLMSGTEAVLKGAKSLAEYIRQEKDWAWAISQKAKTFSIPSGEYSGGKMFTIPKLEKRLRDEKEELAKFIRKLSPAERLEAGISPTDAERLPA